MQQRRYSCMRMYSEASIDPDFRAEVCGQQFMGNTLPLLMLQLDFKPLVPHLAMILDALLPVLTGDAALFVYLIVL